MRVGGWAALISGSLMLLGFLALVLMFQAMSAGPQAAGRFSLFGHLNDLTPLAALLPVLVLAAVFFLLEWKNAPGLSIAALLFGIAAFVVPAVMSVLFMNEEIDLVQQAQYMYLMFGPLGVWLLLVCFLARRESLLPSRVTASGLVMGGVHIVAFVAVMLLTGLGFFRSPTIEAILSDPLLLVVVAVGLIPTAIAYYGLPLWYIWLGGAMLREARTRKLESVPLSLPARSPCPVGLDCSG